MRNTSNPLFGAAIGLLLGSNVAIGGSATWLPNPTSGNWNEAANWTPSGPPNSETDVATFAASTINNLYLSSATRVEAIIFDSSIKARYTIRASDLGVFGSGFTNSSGFAPHFIASGGKIDFWNTAAAGSNTEFTIGDDVNDSGLIRF